jgi:hypothetical protein
MVKNCMAPLGFGPAPSPRKMYYSLLNTRLIMFMSVTQHTQHMVSFYIVKNTHNSLYKLSKATEMLTTLLKYTAFTWIQKLLKYQPPQPIFSWVSSDPLASAVKRIWIELTWLSQLKLQSTSFLYILTHKCSAHTSDPVCMCENWHFFWFRILLQ